MLADKEHFENLSFGIDQNKLEIINDSDLKPSIQLKNNLSINRAMIRQKYLSFTDQSSESLILFKGDSVLGYPHQLELVKNKFLDHNLILALPEFSSQLALNTLAKSLPTSALIVHALNEKEQLKQTFTTLKRRYLRAAKERRVNVLIIHPLFNLYTQNSIFEENLTFFKELNNELQAFGFKMQAPKLLSFYDYNPIKTWELYLISLLLLVSLLCSANLLFPLKKQISLLISTTYVLLIYLFQINNKETLWALCLSFLLATLVPFLSLALLFPLQSIKKNKTPYLKSLSFLIMIFLCALGGGLMISAMLSQPAFLLGIKRFIGVKTSFILPILATALYFYLRPERLKAIYYVFKRILFAPLRSAYLVLILFFLFIVILLVLRSDHQFSFIVPNFEKSFRELLENLFFARPRFKEFLIGYPFLMTGCYLYLKNIWRQLNWFFIVIGCVAPISIINSFCHVHTPLNISLYRSFLGFFLGFILSSTIILLINFFRKKENTLQ